MIGSGPKRADVMIIGEAPGATEDNVGLPFQGKSGKLLDALLDDHGLERRKIYVTNVVKCRPPENAKPSSAQIKACAPYLRWEFEHVKPKKVLALGAIAVKALKLGKVTEIRGQPMKTKDGIDVMATFHPSAALRDPTKHPALEKDISRFAMFIDDALPEKKTLKYRIIRGTKDWDEFLESFKRCSVFSFDVETTSLKWFLDEERVNSIQFGLDDGETWVLPLNAPDSYVRGRLSLQAKMLALLVQLSEGKHCAAHNGKFDNLWLRKHYGVSFHLTFDTMLASHTLDENRSHELKQLAPDLLDAPDYDVPLKVKQFLVPERIKDSYDYAAADGYWELGLYHHFRPQFLQDRVMRRLFFQLVMPAARMFEDIEENGLWIDLERQAEVRKELEADMRRVLKELNGMVKKPINWGSPDQLAKLLFEDLGLEVLDKTPGGKPSTDESVLLRLAEKHPIAQKLIEYRGIAKNLSTYVNGWDKFRVGNHLYLSTKLHGTVTGRYSSRLHQVPRDPKIRSILDAPPPGALDDCPEGWYHGQADYSQIELRLVAHDSGDRRLKMVFQSGGDAHATTASEILGKDPDDLTKEERKQAKPVNFGFIYGMWWKKFLIYARDNYGVVFTEQEAQMWRKRFFEIYSGIEPWHERKRKAVRMMGYVVSLSGRKRRLPGAFSSDDMVRQEAERQAINSPIQGFGSGDMKAMAMVELHEKFRNYEFVKSIVGREMFPVRNGIPDIFRIVGEVHDSILFWVRRGWESIVLPHVKRIMESPALFDVFKIELDVPIVVDIEIGAWGTPIASWKDGKLIDKKGKPFTSGLTPYNRAQPTRSARRLSSTPSDPANGRRARTLRKA